YKRIISLYSGPFKKTLSFICFTFALGAKCLGGGNLVDGLGNQAAAVVIDLQELVAAGSAPRVCSGGGGGNSSLVKQSGEWGVVKSIKTWKHLDNHQFTGINGQVLWSKRARESCNMV
ncbi:hypothetical protein LINGRAHAP2_LOCUS31675, partial [Linum grandiflorum]